MKLTYEQVIERATQLCEEHIRQVQLLMREADAANLDEAYVLLLINAASVRVSSKSSDPSSSAKYGFTIM